MKSSERSARASSIASKTPSPSERAKELFDAAKALQGESRLKFLREQCGADDALRAEVEGLLELQEGAPTLSATGEASRHADALLSRFPVPMRVSHYRIVGELGHGGMGIVYRAIDVRLNRTVAIKVLPPSRQTNAQRRKRFIREGCLPARWTSRAMKPVTTYPSHL